MRETVPEIDIPNDGKITTLGGNIGIIHIPAGTPIDILNIVQQMLDICIDNRSKCPNSFSYRTSATETQRSYDKTSTGTKSAIASSRSRRSRFSYKTQAEIDARRIEPAPPPHDSVSVVPLEVFLQ
eukprot:Tbor_TRINITY_DN1049_c0_g1::TRINITY_DN1049_c0_g1_i1::g.12395::m.12395